MLVPLNSMAVRGLFATCGAVDVTGGLAASISSRPERRPMRRERPWPRAPPERRLYAGAGGVNPREAPRQSGPRSQSSAPKGPHMLDQHAALAGRSTLVADQQVALCGIGTALPPHAVPQDMVELRARAVLGPRYPQFERLAPAFANSGVKTRYVIVSPDWFEQPRGWSDRNAAYLAGAKRLFIDAARTALVDAGMTAADVDCIVTVSSTGIAAPSLEAQAAAEMGFRTDVMRVPVFGLGCAGGVTGLALAERLARATPGTRVLMVAVEACSMAFRDDRLSKADIIATILFGDGAAAAVLSTRPTAGTGSRVTFGEGQEYMWPDTLAIMGWDVDDAGLGVVFDRSIPTLSLIHISE